MNDRNPIAELEAWIGEHKSRSCTIDIDDGYGATCWRAELRDDIRKVYASEISVQKQQKLDELPGLGPVILAAIDHWNRGPEF